jgi:methyl-accepting chemotaxis protein
MSPPMRTQLLASIRALDELRAGMIVYRIVIRDHVLVAAIEGKQAAEKALEAVVQKNAKVGSLYESLIDPPEERALYHEWKELWERCRTYGQEVIAVSHRSAGGISAVAHKLSKTTVNPIGIMADKILEKDAPL